MNYLLIVNVLASVSFNAIAQVLLRKAMLTVGVLPPLSQPLQVGFVLLSNLWLWLGLACFAVSIGLWLVVLARVPVSVAYPMASLGYVIAAALGVMFLGEAVGVLRIVGLALICTGVVLISRTT